MKIKGYIILSVLFIVVLIVSTAYADVEINAANFPDENFRKYILNSGFDSNRDGILSDLELNQVTAISCYDRSIQDLSGIQFFSELTYLECENNKLTNLDVSNNIKLDYLYCYSNSLTSLNILNNKKLTHLECYSNRITNLDVSNNILLDYLRCDSNRLANLDVSNNILLDYLSCYSNRLTKLDVSNNKMLAQL